MSARYTGTATAIMIASKGSLIGAFVIAMFLLSTINHSMMLLVCAAYLHE